MSNTTTQHTPTPWLPSQVTDAIIVNNNPGWGQSQEAFRHYGGYVVAESLTEEDRAFVLRACNSHEQLVALTLRAQAILAAYLPPDGSSDHETLNKLLELFDGPESRAALAAAGVAQ